MARLRDQLSLDLVSATASTIFNSGALGTSPILAPTAASSGFAVVRRAQITNKSSAAYVSFVLTSEASPSFVASAAGVVAATEGINVPPASSYFLNYLHSMPLWLVASAASTPVQVVFYDSAVK